MSHKKASIELLNTETKETKFFHSQKEVQAYFNTIQQNISLYRIKKALSENEKILDIYELSYLRKGKRSKKDRKDKKEREEKDETNEPAKKKMRFKRKTNIEMPTKKPVFEQSDESKTTQPGIVKSSSTNVQVLMSKPVFEESDEAKTRQPGIANASTPESILQAKIRMEQDQKFNEKVMQEMQNKHDKELTVLRTKINDLQQDIDRKQTEINEETNTSPLKDDISSLQKRIKLYEKKFKSITSAKKKKPSVNLMETPIESKEQKSIDSEKTITPVITPQVNLGSVFKQESNFEEENPILIKQQQEAFDSALANVTNKAQQVFEKRIDNPQSAQYLQQRIQNAKNVEQLNQISNEIDQATESLSNEGQYYISKSGSITGSGPIEDELKEVYDKDKRDFAVVKKSVIPNDVIMYEEEKKAEGVLHHPEENRALSSLEVEQQNKQQLLSQQGALEKISEEQEKAEKISDATEQATSIVEGSGLLQHSNEDEPIVRDNVNLDYEIKVLVPIEAGRRQDELLNEKNKNKRTRSDVYDAFRRPVKFSNEATMLIPSDNCEAMTLKTVDVQELPGNPESNPAVSGLTTIDKNNIKNIFVPKEMDRPNIAGTHLQGVNLNTETQGALMNYDDNVTAEVKDEVKDENIEGSGVSSSANDNALSDADQVTVAAIAKNLLQDDGMQTTVPSNEEEHHVTQAYKQLNQDTAKEGTALTMINKAEEQAMNEQVEDTILKLLNVNVSDEYKSIVSLMIKGSNGYEEFKLLLKNEKEAKKLIDNYTFLYNKILTIGLEKLPQKKQLTDFIMALNSDSIKNQTKQQEIQQINTSAKETESENKQNIEGKGKRCCEACSSSMHMSPLKKQKMNGEGHMDVNSQYQMHSYRNVHNSFTHERSHSGGRARNRIVYF